MDSSEGSFAWTDASNDSTDNNNMVKTDHNLTQSGEDSESGKTYKKRLRKYLFSGSGDDEASEQTKGNRSRRQKLSRQQSDTDKNHSKKIEIVKAEPESDADKPKKKKKYLDLKQDRPNDMYDESFLNSKVKNEQRFVVPSPVKAKKNKKKDVLGANETICNGDANEPEVSFLSEPKDPLNSSITTEDSSTLDSGKEKKENENKCHIMKSKKIKKKSKKKRISSEVDDVLNDAEKNISKAKKLAVAQRQSVLADEQSDSSNTDLNHTLPDNTSTYRESRKCEETVLIDNGTQNYCNMNSESLFTKRKSRMSERIQFEDEDDSDAHIKKNMTNTAIKSTEGNELSSFIEKSSIYLRPIQGKLPSALIVTEDDDVWLIRCPKDVPLEGFQDQKWVLNSKCKIKLDGLAYEGDISDTESNMTILSSTLGKSVVKNVKVNGCIRLRRRLPKAHIRDDNIMVNNQTNFIPLPDTKCRHPLFGLNYKKDIKLPSRAAARLRAPPAPAHRNKRERERSSCREVEAKCITGKKRKRTSSKAGEQETAARHKRTKRDLPPADVWDSEKAIEENLFNF